MILKGGFEMVIINQIESAKIRHWLKTNIHLVILFRLLRKKEQEAEDALEKHRMNAKIRHIQNKIERMVDIGKGLGLEEKQIKNINLIIIERATKGEKPEMIIQYLLDGKSRI